MKQPTGRLRLIFVVSLVVSIICNGTISYLMWLSGTSLPEYFRVLFSLDVGLTRDYVDSLRGPSARSWMTILYAVDFVFFVALGVMASSASILICRNEKAFGILSKLGKPFAVVGILMIAIDFAESCLAVYMFTSSPTYPDWIAIPHSLLFILAIVVDGTAGLFLLTSLLASIIRRAISIRKERKGTAVRSDCC